MAQSTGVFRFFAFFFSLIGLLFLIISLPTHHWYVETAYDAQSNTTYHAYGGIFENCEEQADGSYSCTDISGNGYIRATKAFMVLAIIAYIIGVIYLLLMAFTRGIIYKIAGGILLVAAFCTMISVAIYTNERKLQPGMQYGWSYGLGWASFVFSFLSALMFFFSDVSYERI